MSLHVVVKKNIRIDGKDYASLDEVPADKREAVAQAIASIPTNAAAHRTFRLSINGHEYTSREEVPPALRGLLEGAVSTAVEVSTKDESRADAIRPEPLLSPRAIAIAALAILLLALVARHLF